MGGQRNASHTRIHVVGLDGGILFLFSVHV